MNNVKVLYFIAKLSLNRNKNLRTHQKEKKDLAGINLYFCFSDIMPFKIVVTSNKHFIIFKICNI